MKNTHTYIYITPATTLQLQFGFPIYKKNLKNIPTHIHTYYASHRIALFLNLGSLIYSVYIEKSHKKKHTKTKIAHKRTTTAFSREKEKRKKTNAFEHTNSMLGVSSHKLLSEINNTKKQKHGQKKK